VLSVFGSNLSWYTDWLRPDNLLAGALPFTLGGTQVYVDNVPAPLLYVSPGQINFIVPSNQIAGDVQFRVVRQGLSGPSIGLTLRDAAPALFVQDSGYAIATDAAGKLLTADHPASAGNIVVVYATGLGRTQPNPAPGEVPTGAAQILELRNLTVMLDGISLPPFRIKYAGVTPYCAGLYQLNVELPLETGPDPEIRISIGEQSSLAGLRLPVEVAATMPQPGAHGLRF
jgi:uncharacterized protein (TIGR03437 family)